MASLANDITNKLVEIRRHLNRLYRQVLPSALKNKRLVVHLWSTLEQIEPIDDYINRLELLLLELDLLRDEAATQHHPHVERPTTGALRLALTPQQKQLKRQYKLEQQMAADKVPSFEEVWTEVLRYNYEYDYKHALDMTEADDEDVLLWMEDQGIEIPEEPDGYSDDYDAFMELVNQHREAAKRELVEEHFKAEARLLYDEALTRVTQWLDGQDCWRAQALAPSVDPTEHPQLGTHWTFDDNSEVLDYIIEDSIKDVPPNAQKVVYRARIDLQNIDKAGTMWANFTFGVGDLGEQEVRFYKGAPIYVYSVELEDGTVVEINDWRIT